MDTGLRQYDGILWLILFMSASEQYFFGFYLRLSRSSRTNAFNAFKVGYDSTTAVKSKPQHLKLE
jgi:hypothetical protein